MAAVRETVTVAEARARAKVGPGGRIPWTAAAAAAVVGVVERAEARRVAATAQVCAVMWDAEREEKAMAAGYKCALAATAAVALAAVEEVCEASGLAQLPPQQR